MTGEREEGINQYRILWVDAPPSVCTRRVIPYRTDDLYSLGTVALFVDSEQDPADSTDPRDRTSDALIRYRPAQELSGPVYL